MSEKSENSLTLPSFAKINLFLRVEGKRADGFHELCTVFQTVSLCDYLTFSRADEITLTCSEEKIPLGDENLIVKAAKFLGEKYAVKTGAKIHLEKHIPAPGGLGGGSSNAAVALIGLHKLWNLNYAFEDLRDIGKRLGSDVPFFFCGGTALGTGRGTEISLLDDFSESKLLIVTPNVDVSTKTAFARLKVPDLTNKTSKSILQICCDTVSLPSLQLSALKNDFEPVIFEIEPEIREVKEKLVSGGAVCALMSGSGASVFGVFETEEKRRHALKMMREKDWRVFSAETIAHAAYRKSVRLEEISAD